MGEDFLYFCRKTKDFKFFLQNRSKFNRKGNQSFFLVSMLSYCVVMKEHDKKTILKN